MSTTVRKGAKNKEKPLQNLSASVFFIVVCVALLNWKHQQGMIKGLLPFCIRKLNTCRSFCLEKRWLKRVWWAPVRSQAAKRTWLQSSCISNWRAENLGWIKQGMKMSCGISLAAPGLFPGLFPHYLSDFSSTSHLNALAKHPLYVSWGLQPTYPA